MTCAENDDVIYIHEDAVKRLIDALLDDPEGRLGALAVASAFIDYEARMAVLAYINSRLGEA